MNYEEEIFAKELRREIDIRIKELSLEILGDDVNDEVVAKKYIAILTGVLMNYVSYLIVEVAEQDLYTKDKIRESAQELIEQLIKKVYHNIENKDYGGISDSIIKAWKEPLEEEEDEEDENAH